MDAKEDSFFILKMFEFVLQVNGKPLPLHLQRKLDMYALKKDDYVTQNIRRAIMVYINDHVMTKEDREDDASKVYEAKMRELWKEFSLENFLKFLSQYAYETVVDWINCKEDAPEAFFQSVMYFIKSLREKERFDTKSWQLMDEYVITLLAVERENTIDRTPREPSSDPELEAEKEYVLMIMYYVFYFYNKTLPTYLQIELDKYDFAPEPKIKNFVYVLLIDLGKKCEELGEIEPLVLYYYNLCFKHFNEKYLIEFCVSCSNKALVEYFEESNEQAPQIAFDITMYLLQRGKASKKYGSMYTLDNAASRIIDEDRDRVEHERKKRDVSIENSSESAIHPTDSGEILLDSDQQAEEVSCIRRACCFLRR